MDQARGAEDANRGIEAVWRVESAHVIAALARISGDLGVAEDLAHDAFVAALEQWPTAGFPANPFAWLVTVGRRRFIDGLRHTARAASREPILIRQAEIAEARTAEELETSATVPGDDLLRLMFCCCHPVLSEPARVALTLKLLGGLSTEQIAHATLEREPTVAQRIVRAKRSLAAARITFELPSAEDLRARVDSVLGVLYLIFNEGYVASSGRAWTNPTLCREALRLGRVLAELLPGVEEVHGLVALMELQASRLGARIGPDGEPVLLSDQDRTRWDRLLIRRGLAALDRASKLGRGLGPYGLQAAIAACHATAPSSESTDWVRIAALYDALGELAPSPVVELNRAVAVSMAYGPDAGLGVLEAVAGHPAMSNYYLFLSVRGDLLERIGRFADAEAAFRQASEMTGNERERTLLHDRAIDVGRRIPPQGS
jgi:RNA polymerase sigma factor (sigma-70 family)